MALLASCSSITKSFGSRPLFEDISLGISEGERLGLIGANGSGKTTLLRILAGRLAPDSGTVTLRRQTRVGYVPQQAEFSKEQTVAEVIGEAIAEETFPEYNRAPAGSRRARVIDWYWARAWRRARARQVRAGILTRP